MPNELHSLSNLFHEKLFRIPDYQRGYAWKREQLADFWEDLLNLHEDRYHYSGLLSLKELKSDDIKTWGDDKWLVEDRRFKPFHVVDGQQRLTTLSILMYEIVAFVKELPENQGKADHEIILASSSLEKIKDQYILQKYPSDTFNTYLFGYEADDPSANYLKYKIFNEPGGGEVVETYYTQNLKYTKSFFVDALKEIYKGDSIQGIERLYKKIAFNLMFNLHEIKDDYDVFVAFETMNNRGKRLTNLELLKNRLIYLTTLFDDAKIGKFGKDELRKNINQAWKEVYSQLGRKPGALLPDDEFLRAHWITYFQYSRKDGNDYIRFLLEKFSAKNVFEKHIVTHAAEASEIVSDSEQDGDENGADTQPEDETVFTSKLAPKEIKAYVNSLKSLAKFWYYSFFPYDSDSPFTSDEKEWIDKLNRIGIGYFRPLVVAALATEKTTTPAERVTLFNVSYG